MRIGLVLDRFDPSRGGAERALADLARTAAHAGHEVLVFALQASFGGPGRFVRVKVPPSPRGVRDTAFARRAVASARKERCDVVVGVRHVTGVDVYWPHGGVHAETLAAVERSKKKMAAAVSRALHATSPKQRALLALERRFFERPANARIWCVSDLVRREIVSRWPHVEAQTELVRNAVDRELFHPRVRDEHRAATRRRLDIAASQTVLLFLGGAWRLKGFPVLLDALARMRDLEWTCVAAGAREEAAVRAVRRAGLRDRVRVVPRSDPLPLYGAADLLVQPTWRDPCSLATLEALACGIPVVTTDANGAAEGEATRLGAVDVVAAGDVSALVAALRAKFAQLVDAATAVGLSDAARATAPGRDAWDRQVLAALERATSSGGRRR
jgi:UDP-glucose:(heptosyl)LPS alpha-1,3-glucosyltransferase